MGRPTDKNLKRWSGEGRAAYSRTRRAKARAQRIATRAALEAAKVPKLFGAHTHTLMLLAKHGVARRADLMTVLSPVYVDTLKKNRGAGYFLQWKLPNIGAQRGIAICIHPQFPLAREVRQLALKLYNTYRIPPMRNDIRKEEKVLPKRYAAPKADLDVVLGFPHRTAVLASLEYQGGRVQTTRLERGVPGLNREDVSACLAKMKTAGFVVNTPGHFEFAKQPWTKELRSLLKAYLKLRPDFVQGIELCLAELEYVQEISHNYGLFGMHALDRSIVELATRGTITEMRLREYAVLSSQVKSLDTLKKMGIVAVQKRCGLSRLVSLNSAHPLYHELVALGFAMEGKRLPKKLPPALHQPRPSYGYERLLSTHSRLGVLMHIALAPSGEIDLSTLKRLLRQHDRYGMKAKLQGFEDLGFVTSRRPQWIRYYRLNEKHPACKQLRALLLKIAEMDPDYKAAAKMGEDLQPPGRKTHEQNRRRKEASRRSIC